MSQLDLCGSKKRKKGERGERIFKFKTFGENGYPVENRGLFWENVRALLEFGHMESSLCNGRASWSFQLEVHRQPPLHILLFVVEEPTEVSVNHHCKHCQYVGWGHHMKCNKMYHFLLHSKDIVAANSIKSKSNLVELKGHIMHGVFHSNGFGHLLCLNGLEMGSDLAGHKIMDFWDRLCTGLQARKVSLYDSSQKRSMDLRLLHGVAYSEPWFGRWGYIFGRGSFGVTQPMYQKAIEAIQVIPLCLLLHHLGTTNHEISIILSKYQTLSGHSLVTLGNLFHLLFKLKSRLPKESCFNPHSPNILVETSCRWSPKRIEMATRVIVKALKRAEFRWVSRQEVRDMARAYIGDTGLLDFVLKSLGNQVVENYLVRRSLNPVTKVLEYCLEDISNQEGLTTNNSKVIAGHKITRAQLMKDMFYLYKHIFKEQKPMINASISSTIQVASRIILDTRYLIKDYFVDRDLKFEAGFETNSKLYSTILFSTHEEVNKDSKMVTIPYESFMLRHNATFDELKLEVERNFREIYWGLRGFSVKSIANLTAKGSDLVFGVVELGGKVVFEAINEETGIINEDMIEGTQSKCVVDCCCGAKDDDGERLVSCDICEVWQHTRCVHIPNNEEVPSIFLCSSCENDILLFPSLP